MEQCKKIRRMVTGAGSVLILLPTAPTNASARLYCHIPNKSISDTMHDDWSSVGQDIRNAMTRAKSQWDEQAEKNGNGANETKR